MAEHASEVSATATEFVHEHPLLAAIKDIGAGSVGGALQVLVGHPLDTVKVRLQTSPDGHYSGMMDCIRKTVQAEGITGLYKGMSSPLVGVTLLNAIMFVNYGLARRVAAAVGGSGDPNKLTIPQYFGCGIWTGFAVALVESPVDNFKAKMQIQYSTSKPEYHGALDAASKIARNHGIRGVYQGLPATWFRNVPANAMYFGCYEISKKLLTPADRDTPSSGAVLLAGGIAGIMYWSGSYPQDVIKSSMQTDAIVPSQRKYKSIADCARQIYATSGVRGFFKGFTPCLVRSFPANAVCFYGYEVTLRLING